MSYKHIMNKEGISVLPAGLEQMKAQFAYNGNVIKKTVVTTDTTAGASTYTAAALLGGLIRRDCAGTGRSDVTPTAVHIIAAILDAKIGDSFEFIVDNISDAAETITITAGTGVTLTGVMTIAQHYAKRFLAVVTSATTVTIYCIGYSVNTAI